MKNLKFYDQTLKLPDFSTDELREKLRGKTWEFFVDTEDNAKYQHYDIIENIPYFARCGLHLQRPAVVIIAQNKFVVIRYPRFEAGGKFSIIWHETLHGDNHSGFTV